MKKIYLLVMMICLLSIGCKKEEPETFVGNWMVTQRSPYSHEVNGNPSFDPKVLVDVKPGYFTWQLLENGTYTSINTTYTTVASSGRYNLAGNKLTITQEKSKDISSPLVSVYEFKFADKNQTVIMSETSRQSGEVIFIIKMSRM